MKTKLLKSLLLFLLLACAAAPALAQETDLSLRLSKVFGYSGFGNREIQGVMKLTARGPEDLQRVVFLLDGQPMGEDTTAPFELQFDTSSYALGVHTLTATGTTAGGGELQSNAINTEFMSSERGMQRGLQIVGPMLAIILGAMLLSFVIPLVMSRGKMLDTPLGAERNYGAIGGTVCPRCKRPFPLHLFAPNLGPGHKLERCPYCGRFGLVRRYPLRDLRAAEAAELEMAGGGLAPALSEEEKLHKGLEESRYHDV